MSGFGLGGFANGFIQGFDSMGQHFARRGVLDAEARNQARQDQTLEIETALKREQAAREAEKAGYENAQTAAVTNRIATLTPGELAQINAHTQNLDANTDETRALTPVKVAQGEATTGNIAANTDKTKTLTPIEAEQGKAQTGQTVAQTKNIAATTNETNTMLPARLAQTQAQTGQTVAQTGVLNATRDDKALENAEKQQQQAYRQQNIDMYKRLAEGRGTSEDHVKFAVLHNYATMPPEQLQKNLTVIEQASKAHAQTKDLGAINNNPAVMQSFDAVLSPIVNQTQGQPLDKEGKYVFGPSRVVGFAENPDDPNVLGLDLEIQPELSPAYRQQVMTRLQASQDPKERAALEAELNPPAYRAPLTRDRVPGEQGGQRAWFGPEEFKGLASGLATLANWQQDPGYRTQLLKDLDSLQSGEASRGDEVSVRRQTLQLEREKFDRQKEQDQIKNQQQEQRDKDAAAREQRRESRQTDSERAKALKDNMAEATKLIKQQHMIMDSGNALQTQPYLDPAAAPEIARKQAAVRKLLVNNPGLSPEEAVIQVTNGGQANEPAAVPAGPGAAVAAKGVTGAGGKYSQPLPPKGGSPEALEAIRQLY